MTEKPLRNVLPTTPTTKTHAIKSDLRSRRRIRLDETVANDVPVNIYINNECVTTMLTTPSRLKELAVGFLVDEGILRSKEEIKELWVKGLDVHVSTESNVKARLQTYQVSRLVTTACGSVKGFLRLLDRVDKPTVTSKTVVTEKAVLQTVVWLNKNSKIFKETGGTHVAALSRSSGEPICFAEDVGRHNAIDKVIGEAILSNVDLSGCILASTGRQSADMVLKAARVGIPVVASIAGPLHSGIYAANETGVTLICFVKGLRMNIYTHPERVLQET